MKNYVKPMMESEVFAANEYISACYSGNCNISGEVYMDTNGNGIYDKGIDQYKYYNSACREEFVVTGQSSPEPKANAFVVGRHWVWDVQGWFDWGHWEEETTPVYIFDDVHVATMDSIRTHERPNHS